MLFLIREFTRNFSNIGIEINYFIDNSGSLTLSINYVTSLDKISQANYSLLFCEQSFKPYSIFFLFSYLNNTVETLLPKRGNINQTIIPLENTQHY